MNSNEWYYKEIGKFTLLDATHALEAGFNCIWVNGKVKYITQVRKEG